MMSASSACAASVATALLAAVVLTASPGPASALMKKELVPVSSGALALDGTPAGYYYEAGAGFARFPGERDAVTGDLLPDAATNPRWVVAVFGGGWCYNMEECAKRSGTILGSSSLWPSTAKGTGVLSPDAKVNPGFASFNKVHVLYTDGASLTGDVESPVRYNSTLSLRFRGARHLPAIVADLHRRYGFATNATTEVLFTGCSAGGLTTFIHANTFAELVHSTAPAGKNITVRAMPQSGFFLDANNVKGVPVYPKEMQGVFEMQQSQRGVDPHCLKANPSAPYVCLFSQYQLEHIKIPVFPINSRYDWWQMNEVLMTDAGKDWATCAWKGPLPNPPVCTPTMIDAAITFGQIFDRLLLESTTIKGNTPRNGAFVHSCWSHCASFYDEFWSGLRINGTGISMSEAVQGWYFGTTFKTVYSDCHYSDSLPYNCNSLCPAFFPPGPPTPRFSLDDEPEAAAPTVAELTQRTSEVADALRSTQ